MPPIQPPVQSQNPSPFNVSNNPYASPTQPEGSGRKGLIIAIIAGIFLLSIILIVTLVAKNSQSGNNQEAINNVITESQAPSLDPATTIMLNQAAASISQDLSSMNDAEDFAQEPLADKALGL